MYGIPKNSEREMMEYLLDNGINFTLLRYFNRSMRDADAAQLNVIPEDKASIVNYYFCPDGIETKDVPYLIQCRDEYKTHVCALSEH